MNKTKLIIFIGIIIGIFTAIYFLIPTSAPSKINVVVTILDNQNLNTYTNKVIERTLEEIMINNPTEIDLSLLTVSKDSKYKVKIKMKPGDSDVNWKNNVRITLEKLLKNSTITAITNQSINDLFIQSIQMIKDNVKEEGNYFIITGSFPECYDKASSLMLKNKIIEITNGIHTKGKIIWSVLDTRENEEEVLKSLISTNFCSIIDRRIIFDKSRDCIDKNSQQVFGIFFDKLDNEKANEFINFLKNKFGDNIKLTVWNDGIHNNKTSYIFKKDSLNLDALNILRGLEKARWTSIGFLIKQAANHLTQFNDSTLKNLIIIGNLPREGKGNQLDKETWQLLQKINELSVILYRPSYFKENEIDKVFKEGLKLFKINYNKGDL